MESSLASEESGPDVAIHANVLGFDDKFLTQIMRESHTSKSMVMSLGVQGLGGLEFRVQGIPLELETSARVTCTYN